MLHGESDIHVNLIELSLSQLSSKENIFKGSTLKYEESQQKACYKLNYQPQIEEKKSKYKNKLIQNIAWFNPGCSKSVTA